MTEPTDVRELREQPPAEPRELVCMLCSTEYSPWFAPSELWNAAVRRSDGSDEFPFLCPTCFTRQALLKGINQVFVLSTDTEPHEREAELTHENERLRERLERLEALEAGEVSDGYHTHRELYEYRMLYNAHAVRGWLAAGIPVVKSWKHSDGEPCFGGGWFVVVATLPTGQVSNHYAAEHWHLFDVPEVDLPPEYDGHTPADAAERLRAALATPAPAPQQGGR